MIINVTPEESSYIIQALEARARTLSHTSHGGKVCLQVCERIKETLRGREQTNGKAAGVDSSKFKEF